MGNPGVRLLVPAARVRDVRPMGEEGKHARFSLHCGAHRALGVSFGRSKFGVGADDPVDAAVRLEVNHWNGAVEPRVVLRELYPHEDAAGRRRRRRRRGLVGALRGRARRRPRPPSRRRATSRRAGRGERTVRPVSGSAAATLAELASSGAEVLGLVADLPRRAPMARTGARLAEYAELERDPGLAARFEHVVLVDPPPFAHLERLASQPHPPRAPATCTPPGASPSAASRSRRSATSSPSAACSPASSATCATPAAE